MKYIWFLLILILLTACPKAEKYTCEFPDYPVNLSEFNTQYDEAIEKIKSTANELGPNLQYDNAEGYLSQVWFTLSYASDESGNFDIKNIN